MPCFATWQENRRLLGVGVFRSAIRVLSECKTRIVVRQSLRVGHRRALRLDPLVEVPVEGG